MGKKTKSIKNFSKGVEYELVTKAILNQILNQDGAETIELRHREKIRGTLSTHEIDVYWEFKLAGITYRTIVQAKDLNRRMKQADVLAFKAVLNDIPGQPRGVIVTTQGLQKGAAEIARQSGIQVYCLKPYVATPIRISNLGWARLELDVSNIQANVTTYDPEVGLYYNLVGDESLFDPLSKEEATRLFLRFFECDVCNEQGQQITTLNKVIAVYVAQLRKDDSPSGTFGKEFEPATYVRYVPTGLRYPVRSLRIELRILRASGTPLPLVPQGFVRYVLKDLQTNIDSGYTLDPTKKVLRQLALTNVRWSINTPVRSGQSREIDEAN